MKIKMNIFFAFLALTVFSFSCYASHVFRFDNQSSKIVHIWIDQPGHFAVSPTMLNLAPHTKGNIQYTLTGTWDQAVLAFNICTGQVPDCIHQVGESAGFKVVPNYPSKTEYRIKQAYSVMLLQNNVMSQEKVSWNRDQNYPNVIWFKDIDHD